MGYKLHHQRTFWRDTQIGGGTNSYYVAGAILAVVLLLLIIAVYWCRGRNTQVMGLRAQKIFQDARQIRQSTAKRTSIIAPTTPLF